MKSKVALFAVYSLYLSGINSVEVRPWLGTPYECALDASYTYSRFTKVQHAITQYPKAFNNQLVKGSLSFALPEWAFGYDIDFIQTPIQQFSFRSSGVEARYLWLNDVSGDWMSLSTGGTLRGISSRSIRDVSNPFHSQFELMLDVSLGKEWTQGAFWKNRFYFFNGLGTGNRGYPFYKSVFGIETNKYDITQLGIALTWYQGFGPQRDVNIDHFWGYAKIRHQSLDASFLYRYLFGVWGSVSVEYSYRFYARSFPLRESRLEFKYHLPFSMF